MAGVRYTEDEVKAIQERFRRQRAAPQAPCTARSDSPEDRLARPGPTAASTDGAPPAKSTGGEHRLPAKPAARPNRHVVRLEQQLAAHGFPAYVPEYFAIPGRDFRLDYAWPALKVGIELQGVHHREKGKYARDIEKRALHLLAGWRVLELDGKSIKEERSVAWLRALFEMKNNEEVR